MAPTILVVDDEPSVVKMIRRFLESRSYQVTTALDGDQALEQIRAKRPDLVLTDADMPNLDGHSLCRLLRKSSSPIIPLIIMSGAKMDEGSMLEGFEVGADDYILKPFSPALLLARIEAVIRRYQAGGRSTRNLTKVGLELDPDGRAVFLKGKKIVLTRKEFDLLSQLTSQAGRVLSVPYLLETVWGYDPMAYSDRGTVETHVSHLRRKLGKGFGQRIVTVTGHGYKYEDR